MAEKTRSSDTASTEALETGTGTVGKIPPGPLPGADVVPNPTPKERTGVDPGAGPAVGAGLSKRADLTAAAQTETKTGESTGHQEAGAQKEAEPEEGPSPPMESAQAEGEKARAATAEGEKPPDEGEQKPEPRSPESYTDFTLPEGVQLDESGLTEFKSFAKEQDLTQEQAQKVLEFGGQKLKERLEAPFKVWTETQRKWQAEVKADPEIGGTKFEQSIKDAAQVFVPGEGNPFVGSAEEAQALREALNVTGAGNNPALVKFFVKIGRLLAEPGPISGKPTAVDKQGDLLAKMYPTMTES